MLFAPMRELNPHEDSGSHGKKYSDFIATSWSVRTGRLGKSGARPANKIALRMSSPVGLDLGTDFIAPNIRTQASVKPVKRWHSNKWSVPR